MVQINSVYEGEAVWCTLAHVEGSLHFSVHCRTEEYSALIVQCNKIQCSALRWSTLLCIGMQCTARHCSAVQHSAWEDFEWAASPGEWAKVFVIPVLRELRNSWDRTEDTGQIWNMTLLCPLEQDCIISSETGQCFVLRDRTVLCPLRQESIVC